jgi:hypothetical protein
MNHATKRLTPQQARFVQYYIETSNAKQSAIKAGYSEASAKNANALLQHVVIRGKIEEHENFLIASSGWSKARLVAEMEGVYHKAMADDQLKTALQSLELIGKTIGVNPSTKTMEVKHSFEQLLDKSQPTKDITPQAPAITVH